MLVVVAGGGKVGSHLAHVLKEADHDVALVERRKEQCAKLADQLDVTIVCGDSCEPHVLDEAHMGKADAVVAVTGDDEDNLVISLLGKFEYEVPLTIARVNNPKNEWLFTRRFGVDIPVCNTQIIAKLLEETVRIGDVVTLFKSRSGEVALVELTLSEESVAAGRQIDELALPSDSVVVTIIRDEQVLAPEADIRLKAGDQILVMTSTASEPKLAEILGNPA